MKELEPSKYILSNIEADETLVAVFSTSKGLFNSNPDIALTTKRIFSRDNQGNSNSFPFSKIKNVEAVPSKGLFSQKKSGKVLIYGPYKKIIEIMSEDVEALKTFIDQHIK